MTGHNQGQMPGSIVTLKNVQEKDREVWLDLTPGQITAALQAGAEWLDGYRFLGGTYTRFVIRVSNIMLVEEYR